ncbi:hypothetical protein N7470_003670 [Penicillium chermesinum]|nr:hypothetical protein N7470_003670 [Penicillium chermesinum]
MTEIRWIIRPWLLLLLLGFFMKARAEEEVVVTVTATAHATTFVQATPTVPKPASYTSLSDFQDTVLRVSNQYRATHDAASLVWNETLADYSQKWAEKCIWKHSDGPYGENLAFGYANASAAVIAWGDEGELYNFQKPTGFTEETGHFTQLVWKSTTGVGCAAVNCGYTDDKTRRDVSPRAADGTSRAQGWYVVCEYTPAGNVVGDHNAYFKKNVSPKNTAMTTSSTTSSASSTATTTAPTSSDQPQGGAGANSLESPFHMMLLALGTVGVGMGLYT